MRLLWAQPAQDVLGSARADLAGLWSALYAAENAALWLAHSHPQPTLPTQPQRTLAAAVDLAEALDALESVAPCVLAGDVVDLGPVTPLDDVATCLEQTAGLLRGLVALADEVLRAGGSRLGLGEAAAVAAAGLHAADAYRRLAGEPQ